MRRKWLAPLEEEDEELAMLKDKRKIDGLWYSVGEWYAAKGEAQAKANRLRKSGQFKNVRVIKQVVDRRYARYWVYTR